ncbi:hypothetical protein CC78DRAFT_580902 [Lojkania enalia]|uniref:Uncharacterized protein n=1 Tax=Lojkania enalia TaxID=147567 RepID=A0A9P4N316_9PLEO|nr:hypothetical protein CC78DRAFT_580902 [Didymosphaeria enalia]
MAPLPSDAGVDKAQPDNNQTHQEGGWSTASIVGLSIFAFFIVCFAITGFAYWYHRRAERNKLPPEHRPTSYHPFRTASSAKSSLLANAAPSPEDDKRSMFSRESRTSVSLYVDTDVTDRRASMETVSLIPLHVTPAEEVLDPMERHVESNGSGVSRQSTRTSGSGSGSVALSPIPNEEHDLGIRKTRERSTSTASTRYYEANTKPPVPKIVHTPSE